MGVNASMFVKTPRPYTRDEVRRISVAMTEAIGPEHFFMQEEVNRHALELAASRKIEVNLYGRYYGPGYERGDLPIYLIIARYLRSVIPGAEVWYGGDGDLEPMDEEALWTHFVENGHRPYQGYFGEGKTTAAQQCDFCLVSMYDVGGGGGKTFWYCGACGKKRIVRSDGTRYTLKQSEDFLTIKHENADA